MHFICGFVYMIFRLKLKRCKLVGCLFLIICVGLTVTFILSSDSFINGKLSVNLDRAWYPPRRYRTDLDKYLVYKSEILPSLNQSSVIFNKQCPHSSQYVVTVHSCITCDPQRDTIRLTWAKQTIVNKFNVSVYFIIGTSHNKTEYSNTRVAAEDNIHNDIIQFDFIDTYHNLTIKTLAGLHWAAINCPSAKYVIKADQDVYYNLDVITNKLSILEEEYLNSVMGYHFSTYDWINHDTNSKKYIPKDVSVYLPVTISIWTSFELFVIAMIKYGLSVLLVSYLYHRNE